MSERNLFAEQAEINRQVNDLEFKLAGLCQHGMDIIGEELRGFPEELKGGVIEFLKSRSNPLVIDCGAGAGNVGQELSSVARCINIDLFPNAKEKVATIQGDLNDSIPVSREVADLSLSLYVMRYLENPLEHLNDLIRITKQGGFVVINGISAIRFERNGEEYRYFTDWNDKTDNARATLWAKDDWLIIKVNDPTFQFDGVLIPEHSYTIKNNSEPKEIIDRAHFVYAM